MTAARIFVFAAMASQMAAGEGARAGSAGSILVASPSSHDADFAQTVVLLLHEDNRGAIGIILNRPMKMPLADVFPEIRIGRGLAQQAWAGGPVMLGVNALLRANKAPKGADPMLPGVYVLSTKELMRGQIVAGTPSTAFRVYLGLCGWGVGQLGGEMRRGLWRVLAGDASIVFDPAPETLWLRLNRQH